MKDAKTKIINIEMLKEKSKKIVFYILLVFSVGFLGTNLFVSMTEAKEDLEFHLKNWEIEHQKIVTERQNLEKELLNKKQEECKSEKKGAGEKLKINAMNPIEFPLDDKKASELKSKRDNMQCDF